MVKKFTDNVLGFGRAGITLGITSAVVSKAGGNTQALNTASGFMPVIGTTLFGGDVLRITKKSLRRK